MSARLAGMIGAGVFALALIAAVFYFRGEMKAAQGQVASLTTERDGLLALNKANAAEALRQLTIAKDNVRIVEKVTTIQRESTAAAARDRASIQDARRKDNAVADHLDQPIPASVRCVLNGTCANADRDGLGSP